MRVIAVLAATVLVLSACGDDDDDAGTDSATTAAADAGTEAAGTESAGTEAAGTQDDAVGGDADIVIVGFEFPEEIRVAAGAPIVVSNEDSAEHTVTAIDGAFNVTVAGGGTATIDGLEPGTYDFVCNFHGGMEGTLVVE